MIQSFYIALNLLGNTSCKPCTAINTSDRFYLLSTDFNLTVSSQKRFKLEYVVCALLNNFFPLLVAENYALVS